MGLIKTDYYCQYKITRINEDTGKIFISNDRYGQKDICILLFYASLNDIDFAVILNGNCKASVILEENLSEFSK